MVANNGGRYSFFYLEQSIFWEQLIGYNTYKKATGIVYFNLGGIFVETSKDHVQKWTDTEQKLSVYFPYYCIA